VLGDEGADGSLPARRAPRGPRTTTGAVWSLIDTAGGFVGPPMPRSGAGSGARAVGRPDELVGADAQHLRQPRDRAERGALLAEFEVRDVVPRELAGVRELLLAQTGARPRLAQGSAEAAMEGVGRGHAPMLAARPVSGLPTIVGRPVRSGRGVMETVIMWVVIGVVVLAGIAKLVDRFQKGGMRLVMASAAEDHRRCAYCGKRLKYESWASMSRKQVCKWCGREQPPVGWSLTQRMEAGRLVPLRGEGSGSLPTEDIENKPDDSPPVEVGGTAPPPPPPVEAGGTAPPPPPPPRANAVETYETYCVRCRTKQPFAGAVIELKNGRKAVLGPCAVCGTIVSRILPRGA